MRMLADALEFARANAGASPLFATAQPAAQRLLDGFHAAQPGRIVALAEVADGGRILGHQLDLPSPAASSIKAALVAAAWHEASQGRLDLAERVAVRDLPQSKWPSIVDALDEKASLSVSDLCALAIASSDNAASEFLFQRVGGDAITSWLTLAGCSAATMLKVGYGDKPIETSGRLNLITARDAVAILRTILRDALYLPLLRAMLNNVRNQRIPRFLDDDVWVAHKTGSLNGVVNDIAIIFAPRGPFILAVLTDSQPDSFTTEHDMARLAAALVALG
jgi:beta-lactamase class A